MTLKDINKIIAESPNKEFYQEFTIAINYPEINYSTTLKGVASIYSFIENQIEGFESLGTLPGEIEEIKNLFINARTTIISYVNQNNVYDGQWQSALNVIVTNIPTKFLYDSPETEFLIRVFKEQPNSYRGAYEYLCGTTQNSNNKYYLIGYFLAYEFTFKNISGLTERRDSEKKSIARVRSDFQKALGEAESQLVDYLTDAHKKYVDFSEKIDSFKEEKESYFTGWFDTAQKANKGFYEESEKKVVELESLYREKLKLEAPAKYWSDRAIKLRQEGSKWLGGLIVTILVGIALLIWCLSEISAGTLDKIFQNNGTAIKWSVVFITLISFIAFAVKIFSKLTFSSFHLVRDAEEREQLTYVYLALQKEKGIDETERHLIMQSLFSRADSGLLKDDSGPTMPGNIADKIISR